MVEAPAWSGLVTDADQPDPIGTAPPGKGAATDAWRRPARLRARALADAEKFDAPPPSIVLL
jgi:hypothetical protein